MGHKGDILLKSFTKVVTALQTKLKQRKKKGQVIKQYTHPFIQRRGLNNAFYRIVKWVKTVHCAGRILWQISRKLVNEPQNK